jgi:hypothetical protein
MITKIKLILILTLIFLGVGAVFAGEEDDGKAPLGCRNSGYKFDLKTLQLFPGEIGDNQSMYFLYNNLTQPVNLFQMHSDDSSGNTYLNHAINSRQWAVLSTSEKQVKFICTVPDAKSPYGRVIDCAESLLVCEYTNVRYGLNNRGNYWLVNSNTKNGAIREVVHYGIIPGQ